MIRPFEPRFRYHGTVGTLGDSSPFNSKNVMRQITSRREARPSFYKPFISSFFFVIEVFSCFKSNVISSEGPVKERNLMTVCIAFCWSVGGSISLWPLRLYLYESDCYYRFQPMHYSPLVLSHPIHYITALPVHAHDLSASVFITHELTHRSFHS